MNPNESSGIRSPDRSPPDVESLLKQMTLRRPSDQLDVAIANLVTSDDVNKHSVSRGAQFGWTALLATAAAAMLAGIWLGHILTPTWELLSDSNAVADVNSPDAKALTTVSFNVQAFNLLHGHSQQAEFENCDQCHRQAVGKGGGLDGMFRDWFYGDAHFFEAHPKPLTDCSKCHVAAPARQDENAKDLHQEFAKLANCLECHAVNADGFEGFKKDWQSEVTSSEG